MKYKRIIPVLTLINDELVKTVQFQHPRYVGDPINAVKIFNEKEVDEIIIADIRVSANGKEPNYGLIKDIVSEAFMPVCYCGGISHITQFQKIISLGVEKIGINTSLPKTDFIKQAVNFAGSSSVVACLDVIHAGKNEYVVTYKSATEKTKKSVQQAIEEAEDAGVGEIMINHIDRDGTYLGYDLNLASLVTQKATVPVIFCGGASSVMHIKTIFDMGIDAAAAGSMFMFYGKLHAVLINYPNQEKLSLIHNHIAI